MGCDTPTIDPGTWETLKKGDWVENKISKQGTTYWWAMEEDDYNNRAWRAHPSEVEHPPNLIMCGMEEDDYNRIAMGELCEADNFIQTDTERYCVHYAFMRDTEEHRAYVRLYV